MVIQGALMLQRNGKGMDEPAQRGLLAWQEVSPSSQVGAGA
jgi:hypothetical protein